MSIHKTKVGIHILFVSIQSLLSSFKAETNVISNEHAGIYNKILAKRTIQVLIIGYFEQLVKC